MTGSIPTKSPSSPLIATRRKESKWLGSVNPRTSSISSWWTLSQIKLLSYSLSMWERSSPVLKLEYWDRARKCQVWIQGSRIRQWFHAISSMTARSHTGKEVRTSNNILPTAHKEFSNSSLSLSHKTPTQWLGWRMKTYMRDLTLTSAMDGRSTLIRSEHSRSIGTTRPSMALKIRIERRTYSWGVVTSWYVSSATC